MKVRMAQVRPKARKKIERISLNLLVFIKTQELFKGINKMILTNDLTKTLNCIKDLEKLLNHSGIKVITIKKVTNIINNKNETVPEIILTVHIDDYQVFQEKIDKLQ